MQIITCDRCKTVLPCVLEVKKRKFLIFSCYDKVKESYYVFEGIVNKDKATKNITEIHLCKKCQIHFDEWLWTDKWKRKN